MMRQLLCLISLCCLTCIARAQPTSDAGGPLSQAELPAKGAAESIEPLDDAGPDAGGVLEAADAGAEPPVETHGDTPISAQEIVGAPAPSEPPPPGPSRTPGAPAPQPEPATPPAGKLVVWATAEWGNTLGSARCGAQGIEGIDTAIRVAATLKASTAVAGIGLATGGALGAHPLLEYAGEQNPEVLAELLASAGFSAIAVGISDLAGPLFRSPRLNAALVQHGISVIASNLVCGGQAYCQSWHTAEDPLPIVERYGRRYALLALLPDDALERVEPVVGEQLRLVPMLDGMQRRMAEARALDADLVVATIDHGPDTSAAVKLATFAAELPADDRPDLLLSPSAGENMLFLRPLDVLPAIVGTRREVLSGVRVTRLEGRDADVLARSVRLSAESADLNQRLTALGRAFCAARGARLRGARLERPLDAPGFVDLAASAARQLAHADLALVDPRAFEPSVHFEKGAQLERAEVERAVPFDAPLVVADVTLDWLTQLRAMLGGVRPLTLIGVEQQKSDTLIAGRIAVPGAHYRVVTSAVLARSERLPPGADFEPLDEPNASLRGALITLLDDDSRLDPRVRLRDPLLGTQWVTRLDGQLFTNLTANRGREQYDDPALQADQSRQVGGRLVLNADADAPHFLFENVLQVAFDRNFATRTTAQDLSFTQSTYTYRGLWGKPLLYPHPFVEGYLETSFLQPEDASYRHLMLRPRAGFRSTFTRVFSLKVAAGVQYEILDKNGAPTPGLGGELLLKPWTIVSKSGTLQLEGNIVYYWNSPTRRDDHMLRGQLISAYQLIGPLQATLSALAVIRKVPEFERGQGITMQVGLRLRFVSRAMSD